MRTTLATSDAKRRILLAHRAIARTIASRILCLRRRGPPRPSRFLMRRKCHAHALGGALRRACGSDRRRDSRGSLELVEELADVLELAVHAREAHVGHLISWRNFVHHERADDGAGHLAVVFLVTGALDARGGVLELLARHRQLLAGAQHSLEDALALDGAPAASPRSS
jgi:hypothetical protein